MGYVRQAQQLIAFRNALKTGPVSERGRPQSELNAFRNAVKSAAESFRLGNHTQAELPESAFFSRVGQLIPELPSCFESRPFLERVGRFWNE